MTAGVFALGACSANEPPKEPDKPAASKAQTAGACTGKDCEEDGKEITQSPCGESAVDVTNVVETKATTVVGTLVIRKSIVRNNVNCDRLYWAKLATDPSNTTPYKLTLVISQGTDHRTAFQPSDNPALEALTTAVKGRIGQHLVACVNSEPPQPEAVCVEQDVV